VSSRDTDCRAILREWDTLGEDAQCLWQSMDELSILLGRGASISIGDTLSILESAKLQGAGGGKGGVSTPGARVTASDADSIRPVISVQGSLTVDLCSPLELYASSTSARALTFRWGCTDYSPLDELLRTLSGPYLYIKEGTTILQV
jgi:hypothetical protein